MWIKGEDKMITKTEVTKGSLGNKKGWCFRVTWDNRPYPNLISGLYKTKKTAREKLEHYLATKEFDFYGDAE